MTRAGEFALIHAENDAEAHHLRLEGGLIPEWWGRPSDNASLRCELAETGHDGIALLLLGVALVLYSDAGHVDVEIDELISRIGLDPRSTADRVEARLKLWRILTILGAMKVVGARRSVVARRSIVRDRVSGKSVQLESSDALLTVSAWRPVGAQIPLDAGVAPLKVTIISSPWLARWRGDRAILQDFGNLLAISEIPIGKPSGAWARAIGCALHQLWRERATRATYERTGDEHRETAHFRPFTRRELLELFPPRPSLQDVLTGQHPSRASDYASDYWEGAISELKATRQRVIGHYAPTRDWKRDRPRKGWAELWLDEPLDIRPTSEAAQALSTMARTARTRGRTTKSRRVGEKSTVQGSKLAES